MDVKRMSKSIANKIQQNLRPLSTQILPLRHSKSDISMKSISDIPNTMKKIDIERAYKTIKQNAMVDHGSNIKIVTCLKGAQKCWEEFLNSPNKNGQVACMYEIKLKTIQNKYKDELNKLIVQNSMEKMKETKQIFKPMIEYLEKKSKKFREHQNEFKVITRKVEEQQHENQEQEDQIKEEMLDLVEKFKKYAVNIQQNLTGDTSIIKQIGESQDKHLDSLTNKTSSMQQIIKEQKLGFFQLIGMGIFAIVMWVIGIMIIIIV